MYSLSRFISMTRIPITSVKGHLYRQLALLVLMMAMLCSPAAALVCKQASSTSADTLRQVWQDNYNDLWFFDVDGQQQIPTINNDWVAVRFANVFSSGNDMPAVIRQFNHRYAEAVADVIYNPARPDLALYRFKPTHRNGVLNDIFEGGNSTIRYLLPALNIGGQLQVLGETISVRWKSQIRPQRRQQLLNSIGAIDFAADLSGRDEQLQIDPCQLVVWKAANRLAEDVQVVSATPQLLTVEAPVTVHFNIEAPGVVAGAAIPFTLDIVFSDQVRIEPGTLANLNLKPSGIYRNLFAVEYDTPLSAIDVRQSPIKLRGRIFIYASGEFELPSIPVFYREEGGEAKKIHRVSTPVVNIRLAKLVPQAEGDYRLQLPAQLVANDAGRHLESSSAGVLWRGLIASGLLITGLVLKLRRRQPGQQQTAQVVEETRLDRLQQALAVAVDGGQAAALAQVGLELRRYLGDWAAVSDIATGGGSELFLDQLRGYAEPQCQQQIEQTLRQLDDALSRGLNGEQLSDVLKQVEALSSALEQQRCPAVDSDQAPA